MEKKKSYQLMYHYLHFLHVTNGIGFKNDQTDQRIYCFPEMAALY